MLESETLAQGGGKRRKRDGGTGRKPGIKTSGGSMKSPNLVAKTKAGSQCERKLWKEAAGGEEQRLSIVRQAPVSHCLDTESIPEKKKKRKKANQATKT